MPGLAKVMPQRGTRRIRSCIWIASRVELVDGRPVKKPVLLRAPDWKEQEFQVSNAIHLLGQEGLNKNQSSF